VSEKSIGTYGCHFEKLSKADTDGSKLQRPSSPNLPPYPPSLPTLRLAHDLPKAESLVGGC